MNGEKTINGITGVCDYMAQGAVVGSLRGDDSTGMFQIRKDHGVRMTKLPLPGPAFAQTKHAKALFRMADSSLATVLHHRAATHGEVCVENAHPFEHTNDDNYVIGVHNGTVPGFSRTEDGIDFSVDSDWLLYQILKHGPEKALSAVSGAFALVWYDAASKRMNIATNGQREFHWAYVKDKNTMLFASEHAMLYWLARRNTLPIEGIIYPQKGHIYHFDFANLRDYTATKFEVKETTNFTHAATNNSGRTGSGTTLWTPTGASSATTPTTVTALTTTNNRTHEDFIGGTANGFLDNMGLELDEEVEFFPMSNSIKGSDTTDIKGQVLTDSGRVIDAVIPGVIGVKRYNMVDCTLAKSTIYGVRRLAGENGPNGLQLLLRSPNQIERDQKDTDNYFVTDIHLCEHCEQPVSSEQVKGGLAEWFGDGLFHTACLESVLHAATAGP